MIKGFVAALRLMVDTKLNIQSHATVAYFGKGHWKKMKSRFIGYIKLFEYIFWPLIHHLAHSCVSSGKHFILFVCLFVSWGEGWREAGSRQINSKSFK